MRSIQRWMNDIAGGLSQHIPAVDPPAYQSQAGPTPNTHHIVPSSSMLSSPTIHSLPAHEFGNNHAHINIANTITLNLMNARAMEHGCVVRYTSSSTGPDHMPIWTAICTSTCSFVPLVDKTVLTPATVDGVQKGMGTGGTKKSAELAAAKVACFAMNWAWSVKINVNQCVSSSWQTCSGQNEWKDINKCDCFVICCPLPT
jgi:hypothetical protein